MSCYHPLTGYRSCKVSANGKRPLSFTFRSGFNDLPVTVPCGQCIGCRLEKSRQWAMRMVHESKLWEKNCFITLTYNQENLPENGSLVVRHFQNFMKYLRKNNPDISIRFYHCGEYGEQCKNCGKNERYCECEKYIKGLGRPHYHACLFNFDFEDKVFWKKVGDSDLYTSTDLERNWSKGFATVGNLTFKSAAYAARYVTKKKSGPPKEDHYERINKNTGEVIDLKPEYATMSRRPGIGMGFFKEFKDEIYPDDFVVLNDQKMQPPKYYDKQFEAANEQVFELVKEVRIIKASKRKNEQTYPRRMVREKVAKAKTQFLKRTIEEN